MKLNNINALHSKSLGLLITMADEVGNISNNSNQRTNENDSLKVMNSDPDNQQLVRVDDEAGYQLAARDKLGFYLQTDDRRSMNLDAFKL